MVKVLVTHPTGNANVREVLTALASNNMLSEFNTTIATNPNSKWLKIIPESFRSQLLRRKYDIENKLINTVPVKEFGRLVFQKLGITRLTKHESGSFSVDAVYRSIDKAVAKRIEKHELSDRPDAVYSYEDGALKTFVKAKELNILRLYDLPIGYWRAEQDLLGKEIKKRPEWAETLTGFNDSIEKLERKDRELEAAQYIFVASSFTKQTLEYFPGKLPPVYVIPYGFPPAVGSRDYNFSTDRKLKLLFVGGLSQRKGIAEIFDATETLKNQVELTIIGRKSVENCVPLNENLKKHRYIPSLSHQDILKEMRNQDILIFPSHFEGFGLVITEAMSQGTPVITTNRTCGADLITHDVDGWIVEPGSPSSLFNQLKLILDHPNIVEKVGRAAISKARTRPWSVYGAELVGVINKLVQNHKKA